jgi:hypothetical protein
MIVCLIISDGAVKFAPHLARLEGTLLDKAVAVNGFQWRVKYV